MYSFRYATFINTNIGLYLLPSSFQVRHVHRDTQAGGAHPCRPHHAQVRNNLLTPLNNLLNYTLSGSPMPPMPPSPCPAFEGSSESPRLEKQPINTSKQPIKFSIRGFIRVTASPGSVDVSVPCGTAATLCLPRSAADEGALFTPETTRLLLDGRDDGVCVCVDKSVQVDE